MEINEERMEQAEQIRVGSWSVKNPTKIYNRATKKKSLQLFCITNINMVFLHTISTKKMHLGENLKLH